FAASQLNRDDMSAQFRGEKPGSLSIDQIFGFVDEWLSPRGLYRAAVELDLWWDVGQITTEFEEWGAKVEAWNEDKFDPRKMIDMLTGPLDDILFPALNLALMWVGVGEVMAVTRGLALGVKGARVLAGTPTPTGLAFDLGANALWSWDGNNYKFVKINRADNSTTSYSVTGHTAGTVACSGILIDRVNFGSPSHIYFELSKSGPVRTLFCFDPDNFGDGAIWSTATNMVGGSARNQAWQSTPPAMFILLAVAQTAFPF
ncbi:hypothetical protein LCGC14_3027620, partial [marine sediment metagenome]